MSDERAHAGADQDDRLNADKQSAGNESTGSEWTGVESPVSGNAEADLQALVTFIVSNLIDDSEGVQIGAEKRGSSVHLRLRVPPEDLGKVIGRQGRVARAMRTALTIAGSHHNVRTSLDIEG